MIHHLWRVYFQELNYLYREESVLNENGEAAIRAPMLNHPTSQWSDFKWNIWHFGTYELLDEASSNFLTAASFSSKLIWRKNLTHQDELLILA